MSLLIPAQAYSFIPGLSSGADSELTILIARVEGATATHLGFEEATPGVGAVLDATSYTVYMSGPSDRSTRLLDLPYRPVHLITSVHNDTDWVYDSASLVDPSEYVLDGVKGEMWLKPGASASWYHSHRAIKVVMTAGWAYSGAVAPPALLEAIGRWVGHAWTLRSTQGRTQAQAGRGSSSLPLPSMPNDVRQTLRAFRQPSALM